MFVEHTTQCTIHPINICDSKIAKPWISYSHPTHPKPPGVVVVLGPVGGLLSNSTWMKVTPRQKTSPLWIPGDVAPPQMGKCWGSVGLPEGGRFSIC